MQVDEDGVETMRLADVVRAINKEAEFDEAGIEVEASGMDVEAIFRAVVGE